MERYVDGVRFEGHRLPDAWDVSLWQVDGHTEVSARQVIEWREVSHGHRPFDALDPVLDADYIAECKERSLKKSAQRAQTACRRIIKAEGFNELLTITYRQNQTDRELCKKHFKEWVRRMKRALGDFRYCASFEQQERGAMHVHVACHKLPQHAQFGKVRVKAWELGTKIWRKIVGKDNGLVYVGGKSKWGGHRRNMSLAKMAAYVSKYIMKAYAAVPEEKNRYSRSNGLDLPKPTHIRLVGASLADAIGAIFALGEGDIVVSHRIGDFHDSYWLCIENPLMRKTH